MSDLAQLSAEFDRKLVSWRAQTLTGSGDKALALAYIDARDVMRRLDEVCGPAGWEDSYVETPLGRILCTIRVKVGGEWISKSDGAGKTDVEGDKGGISDAFKRAAVKWGIGRYLYDIDSPWVPCEVREHNGKKFWKSWKVDPWTCVRGLPPQRQESAPAASNKPTLSAADQKMIDDIGTCDTQRLLDAWTREHGDAAKASPNATAIRKAFATRQKAVRALDQHQ